MKALKSKTPYLILLAILFCIAVTDSFLWSQKVNPLTVVVEAKGDIDADMTEQTVEPASISFIKFAFTDQEE